VSVLERHVDSAWASVVGAKERCDWEPVAMVGKAGSSINHVALGVQSSRAGGEEGFPAPRNRPQESTGLMPQPNTDQELEPVEFSYSLLEPRITSRGW
jgi:hypothetical protein